MLYVWHDEIAEDMIVAAAESQVATPVETPAA